MPARFNISTTDSGSYLDGSTQVNTWGQDIVAFRATGYFDFALEHGVAASMLTTTGWSLNHIAAINRVHRPGFDQPLLGFGHLSLTILRPFGAGGLLHRITMSNLTSITLRTTYGPYRTGQTAGFVPGDRPGPRHPRRRRAGLDQDAAQHGQHEETHQGALTHVFEARLRGARHAAGLDDHGAEPRDRRRTRAISSCSNPTSRPRPNGSRTIAAWP